jgi:hypothetical protein|tara:strand:- start:1322 stop:1747 length:426 start_codon:yes stop_codon:yes gene_type:complete
MENQKYPEDKVNESNRLKRLGKRALSELEVLPSEALFATLGYKGGESLGKVASTTRSYIEGGNWEANNFVQNIQNLEDILTSKVHIVDMGNWIQNLNQAVLDLEYRWAGGIVCALIGIYSGRKISQYINNKFFTRDNPKIS